MAAVRLSDGGHLAKLANCTIVRFAANGKQLDALKPGDGGYSYWLSLLYSASSREKSTDVESQRGQQGE